MHACVFMSFEGSALQLRGMNNTRKEHSVASQPETVSGQKPGRDQQPSLARGPGAWGRIQAWAAHVWPEAPAYGW